MFVLLLAVAGNETTRNLISGGMLTLMETPDERDRLVADLDRLPPTAVDEMRPAGEAERLRSTLISGIKHMPVSYSPE